MKQLSALIVAGLFPIAFVGCDSASRNDKEIAEQQNEEKFDTNKEEKIAKFVVDAVENQYAEIKLAELANTKSDNKKVHDFAQQMVNTDNTTLVRLQAFASKNGITIPVEESDEAKKKVNALVKENNAHFDGKWCREVMATYKKTIREFERMADHSDNPELAQILENSAGQLQAQLNQLAALQADLGG